MTFLRSLLTTSALAANLALAQGDITLSTSSSFSQTLHTTPREQRVDTYLTRITGRIGTGPLSYDQSFALPLDAPEVQAAIAKASTAIRGSTATPLRLSSLTLTRAVSTLVDTRASSGQANVTRTIGLTRRETLGPAVAATGALATEATPCTGLAGGTPLGLGGLKPGDGYAFHFTMPIVPTGCPLSGTPVAVPAGGRNIDTLVHIHSDIYQGTVVRTILNANTYEIAGTPLPAVSSAAPTAGETPLLVRYLLNLDQGESTVHVTNSGARGAGLAAGTGVDTTGAICVNVYAFSPDDEMVGCCACPVTPNGLVKLSGQREFITNTPAAVMPTSLVVKLIATVPVAGSCSNAPSNPGAVGAPGLHAWGTTIHRVEGGLGLTEGAFLPAVLWSSERERLVARCTELTANGPAANGLCRSCRLPAI